jgi:hypothetical protein
MIGTAVGFAASFTVSSDTTTDVGLDSVPWVSRSAVSLALVFGAKVWLPCRGTAVVTLCGGLLIPVPLVSTTGVCLCAAPCVVRSRARLAAALGALTLPPCVELVVVSL